MLDKLMKSALRPSTSSGLLTLVCGLWAAGEAHAAGYYSTDVGIRGGLGRSGAFAARADDGTAAWYNPAGFADQPGTNLQFDSSFIKQSLSLQRTDEFGQNVGAAVGNAGAPRYVPFLGVSSDFGLKNFVFALSAFGPNGRSMEYPALGSQRYTLISTNVTEAIVQLSVAWRPLPNLRVGAGFRYEYFKATQNRKLSIAGTRDVEDSSDVGLAYTVVDSFATNWQFGILYTPLPWLTLGAGWRPPVNAVGSGDLTVDDADVQRLRASQFPNLGIQGSKIDVTWGMPNIVRAGVRVHEPDAKKRQWDVEVDFVWERWNGFGELTTTPRDILYTLASTRPITLDPIVEHHGYGDAFSVRLGGEIDLLPGRLTLRAGVFYETSAVPANALSASLVDADKIGASLGLSYRNRWLEVSLGYVHIQLASQSVLDSQVRQINLTYIALGAQNQAPVVGNGSYRSGWDNLGLGIRVSFDALVDAIKGKN